MCVTNKTLWIFYPKKAIQRQFSTSQPANEPLLPAVSVSINSSHLLLGSSGNRSSFSSSDANNDVVALGLYTLFSALGTTVNIFEISSLIIEKNLRHHGNVFLVNQALANLLVSAVSFPLLCITILSGTYHQTEVSCWQWYSSLLCFFTSILNFFIIAIENLLRARRKPSESRAYKLFCGVRIVVVEIILTWVLSAAWVISLTIYNGKPNVCRKEYGVSVIFLSFLVPVILTLCILWVVVSMYKRHLNELESRNCLETMEESLQRSLFKSNALAYIMFLLFWIPFAIAVTTSTPDASTEDQRGLPGKEAARFATESPRRGKSLIVTSSNHVEVLLFFAQTYSCICGLVYAFSNSSFGRAFIYLTKYFCCKSHPDFSKKSSLSTSRGTVRVHIGMEPRLGDRCSRSTKLMAAMSMHNRRLQGDRFL